jgi:hypothetical protein
MDFVIKPQMQVRASPQSSLSMKPEKFSRNYCGRDFRKSMEEASQKFEDTFNFAGKPTGGSVSIS